MSVDELDAAIITLMTDVPRIGVYELARRLGVARGTVQSRLDRMLARGVIRDFAPTVDTAALGFPVTAFVLAEITQSARQEGVMGSLTDVPEVLEVHTVTGEADLWIRAVARSNVDLQRVVDRIAGLPAILRTTTTIVLGTEIAYRATPLARAAARPPS
ncbi:Lrp/AsnC family transcriptional regulator [Microbacterium sp.]|uniref:Lrp/AsnC family transcriptional regulator n=1 Tax=Microbacterium sp. TaxID=51671 RepID=UPI003A8C5EB5